MRPVFCFGMSCHWLSSCNARDPAPRVHAPDLVVLRAVAQLVQRDAELGGPAAVVVGHLAVPHGVPGGVPFVVAVAEDEVDLRAAGREVELEARAFVVVAVEADADHVDREAVEVVAAAGVAEDLRGVVVARGSRSRDCGRRRGSSVRSAAWARRLRWASAGCSRRPTPPASTRHRRGGRRCRAPCPQTPGAIHARRVLAARGREGGGVHRNGLLRDRGALRLRCRGLCFRARGGHDRHDDEREDEEGLARIRADHRRRHIPRRLLRHACAGQCGGAWHGHG